MFRPHPPPILSLILRRIKSKGGSTVLDSEKIRDYTQNLFIYFCICYFDMDMFVNGGLINLLFKITRTLLSIRSTINNIFFPVWHQNRLISAGLEPILSHTEKLCIASNYRQFSMNINIKS